MKIARIIAGVVVVIAPTMLRAQASPKTQETVSREEYEKLKREQEQMRREIEDLKRALKQQAQPAPAAPAPVATTPPGAAPTQPTSEAPTAEDFDDLQKQLKDVKTQLDAAKPGTSKFVIAGDMDVGFSLRRGETSTFETGFAPLILFQPTDRILIEAAADIGIDTDSDNNSSTSFDLTIANVSFLVNDNLAVGGGLFVVPFGVYHNHFDPPWINKFPDDPLPFGDDGIAPSSQVGIFARGAYPIGLAKMTYDVYLTNGPNLTVNNPDSAGSLNFDDFTDLNDNKAVGGRIGFLPIPNLEMGYSIQVADTSPQGFGKDVNAVLQAIDLNYRLDCRKLGGTFDMRGEWVISDVDRATYDPDGSLGFGPVTFSNYRQGGYAQLCYRPTHSDNKFFRNTELVSRYDWLTSSLAVPGGDHEKRFTLGVDYWFTPSVVLKAAYQFDDKQVGENQNAFLMQLGIGL